MSGEKFNQLSPAEDIEKPSQHCRFHEDEIDDLEESQLPAEGSEFPLPEQLQEMADEVRLRLEADKLLPEMERKQLEEQRKIEYKKALDELYDLPPDPMGDIDPLRARKRKNK